MSPQSPCIGVFDSGVGGLSVLHALHRAMPHAPLLYVADSGHAPYGERDDAHVLERSMHITRFLRERGAQLLVIACNTATAVAAPSLRAEHAGWPIVGIEPGVKPAAALTHNGHVGVMATSVTLHSARFRNLLEAHGGRATVHLQPCPGLAHLIETGDLGSPELRALIERHVAPLRAAGCDVVVLGCTHYTYAAPLIQAALGGEVRLVDTADAVARHTATLASRLAPASSRLDDASIQLWTSGDPARLRAIAARWLGIDTHPQALQVFTP